MPLVAATLEELSRAHLRLPESLPLVGSLLIGDQSIGGHSPQPTQGSADPGDGGGCRMDAIFVG